MKNSKDMLKQIAKVDKSGNEGLAKVMLQDFIDRDDLHKLNGKEWLELMSYLSRYRPFEPWQILTRLSMRYDDTMNQDDQPKYKVG